MRRVTSAMAVAVFALSAFTARGFADSAGIEEGKAYGAQANAAAPNAADMDPSTVPGYQTSTPSQTRYYGNPAALSSAGSQAAGTNDAAQSVVQGYENRPLFTFDKSTDPMFQNLSQIETGAANMLTAEQGGYAQCQPVMLTTQTQGSTQVCYQTRTTQNESCDDTLTVQMTNEHFNCPIGTWWAQATGHRNGSDYMEAQAYCEDVSSGHIHVRVYAAGGAGACTGWQTVQLSLTAATQTTKIAELSPNWSGGCWNTGVYLAVGSGCNGDSCSYTFGFDPSIWFNDSPTYSCPSGETLAGQSCYTDTTMQNKNSPCAGTVITSTTTGGWGGTFTTYTCQVYDGPANPSFTYTLTLNFTKPRYTYDYTDVWNDGCASLEGAAQ